MLQEFEVYIDTPSPLSDDGFDTYLEDLTELIWELGEEGALIGSFGGLISISVHIDRPTLTDALLYTLVYLKDKNVPVKGLIAPKAD